ncbi:MAG: hypothetical protein DWQ04_09205 [Chloroflexi bacterium]|nr:MAG: hypothetical protein DWQ04_09205 [Chloroflexota bacterium]
MSFVCVECKRPLLTISHSIELGSDGRDDEYSLQTVTCKGCGITCVATYRESRRGASDSWEHLAYKMTEKAYKQLVSQLHACPEPKKHKCTCDAHTKFKVYERGYLNPLSKIVHDAAFFHLKL